MINGNVNVFIDTLDSGQEIIYTYQGKKYCVQGYCENNFCFMNVQQWEPSSDDFVWEYKAKSMSDCRKAFILAKIFNGKSFWDIEQEIEWVDD